ncbi:zinc finger CCCH domain-containing protein 14-like isoform X2 [Gigantopelta aegis]|uniref:zinc finger CCCH domain-containing protein 14-like isoform X2 n=1 Tax=Gigantopelta aegis TaxID=1735272 RepID=UPI001B8876A2|nr:zinc finger CCCH domain-containing protein 14-like isoform X2 [Gigantopelta aegis]
MEIGSEISNKIRSAIKAKLVELGAYVDDELPDYIMVMVANKKSHTQMSEDLGLFLGQNTKKFTSWLNSLLIKLQSISGDQLDSKKKKKSGTKKKSKRRKSSETAAIPTTSVEEKPNRVVGESQTGDTAGTVVPDDEPELTVQADTDEFTEEMKEFEEKSKPSTVAPKPEIRVLKETAMATAKETAKDTAKETIKETAKDTTKETAKEILKEPAKEVAVTVKDSTDVEVIGVTVEPSVDAIPTTTVVYKPSQEVKGTVVQPEVKPRPVTSHVKQQQDGPVKRNIVTSSVHRKQTFIIKRQDNAASVNMMYVQPTRTVSQTVNQQAVRGGVKRRALSSMVGSVIQEPEEVEEEYDPYNPTVGKVASLVRVTARKSSVPPSMQANKSLLLKAMTDAEKSVLTARPQTVLETGVRPTASQAYVMPMRRQTSSQAYIPTQLALTSRSRKEEIMRNMKYTIKNQTEVLVKQEPSRVTEYKSVPVSVIAPDSRVVECEGEEEVEVIEVGPQEVDTSPEVETPKEKCVEADVRIPEILQDADITDEFSVVGDKKEQNKQTVEDKPRIIQEKPKVEVEPAPAASNTRFIVTLDGVDPEEYDEEAREYPTPDIRKTELIQEVLPQVVPKVTPPKIKPFSISLRDSDEEEEESSPVKKAKMAERCRFWPACVNGNACQYHHPSVPCKTFPHCKFGDKCLYIHPNCMFDARCTKRDCPYTHASRRSVHTSPPAMQQPMVIIAAPSSMASMAPVPCKFFPNCHNTQCPFIHPKACRFGFNCMRKSTCPFHHPAFQEKERLTWSANKITLPKT